MTKLDTSKYIERLGYEFAVMLERADRDNGESATDWETKLEDFLTTSIESAVEAERTRLREEVNNLKQPFKVSENMELRESYNSALDKVLTLLK